MTRKHTNNRIPREAEQFWSKIWRPKEHNKVAEWISNMAKDLKGLKEGPKAEIHIYLLRTTLKKYQIGKRLAMMEYMDSDSRNSLPFMTDLALEMNRCLQKAYVPEWMIKGKTTLIQKDPLKGTAPNNYRPVTYLTVTWKILTAQIREEIYYSLTNRGLFSEEQKEYHKGSGGTRELLHIDQSKIRRKNLAKASIDNKKFLIWSQKTE